VPIFWIACFLFTNKRKKSFYKNKIAKKSENNNYFLNKNLEISNLYFFDVWFLFQ